MIPLPHTFRPNWGRRVTYGAAGLMSAVFIGGVLTLPERWGLFDRFSILLVGATTAYFLHRIADVRIACDESGVFVVNVLRSRRLEWAEVIDVRLEEAAPWLVLDISDGTALAAMGIQGSDGAYARMQARELGELVAGRIPF